MRHTPMKWILMRYTASRCTPVRHPPMRYTLVRYTQVWHLNYAGA
jgi:hypothetical protein